MSDCKYCREPLNEGARYCRGCGRKQPRPPVSAQTKRNGVLLVSVALVIGVATALLVRYSDREDRIERLSICVRGIRGVKEATPAWLEARITQLRDQGESFDGAFHTVASGYECGDFKDN